MAKATAKNITSASSRTPACPALAVAKKIGHNNALQERMQELESTAVKAGSDDRHAYENASQKAYDLMCMGEFALTLAPARSLEGAIAKFILANECLLEISASTGDTHWKNQRFGMAGLLFEDAMRYLKTAHGISGEAIGMDRYVSKGPSEVIRDAEELAKKAA